MRIASTHKLVLGLSLLWYGVFIPVHQRGVVKLPGASTCGSCVTTGDAAVATGATDARVTCHAPKPAVAAKTCCPKTGQPITCPTPFAKSGDVSNADGSKDEPAEGSPDQASHCAICFIAGHLDTPPPFVWDLPQVGLLESLPFPAAQHAPHVPTQLQRRGRAPPFFC